jgi:hypothetical protein
MVSHATFTSSSKPRLTTKLGSSRINTTLKSMDKPVPRLFRGSPIVFTSEMGRLANHNRQL